MGCFSFLCKKCERPINSDSFTGQHCTLYLLERGKVVEKMTGQYDSYGRVFNQSQDSAEWKSYPWSGVYAWEDKGGRQPDVSVCDLMFDRDKSNGIAAVHTRCGTKNYTPTSRSDSDPNQGWGRYKPSNNWYYEHWLRVK